MISEQGNFYADSRPEWAGTILYLVIVRNYPERVYKIAWHSGIDGGPRGQAIACYGGTILDGLWPFPQFKTIAKALIFVDKAGGKAIRFKRRMTAQFLQDSGITSLLLSTDEALYDAKGRLLRTFDSSTQLQGD